MKSCIYKITNRINGKTYIGSTKNVKQRWAKHKALLRHNHHPNFHIQAAWNKYGEDSFVFEVVEECVPDELLSREQFFIDTIKPEYNQTATAGKVEMTGELRQKLSASTKSAYKEGRLLKATKKVYQYDLRGNYIREFNSLTEASLSTKTDLANLSEALHGKCNIAGGFVWRFYKAEKLDVWFNRMGRPLTKEPYRRKSIKIVVTGDNEYFIFKNAREVSSTLKCSINQVYNAIRRGSLLFKKYKLIRKKI